MDLLKTDRRSEWFAVKHAILQEEVVSFLKIVMSQFN